MVKTQSNISRKIDAFILRKTDSLIEFTANFRKLILYSTAVFTLLTTPVIPILLFFLSINEESNEQFISSEQRDKYYTPLLALPSDAYFACCVGLAIVVVCYLLLHFFIMRKISAVAVFGDEKIKASRFLADSIISIVSTLVAFAFLLFFITKVDVIWEFLNIIHPESNR